MTTIEAGSQRSHRPIAHRPIADLASPVRPVVWLGVDTHQRTHHAAVCDAGGGLLAEQGFAATLTGYDELIAWAQTYGQIAVAGVESTSSYGAGLTRRLTARGIVVREVNDPDLGVRAGQGKSDPIDAVIAARAVISGRAIVIPKQTTGIIESIRMLKIARDSAVKARTAAYGQLRDLATTAPDDLREQLLPLNGPQRAKLCRRLRPRLAEASSAASWETITTQAAKHALRSLANRIGDFDQEIADLDQALTPLVTATAPRLCALNQVGIHTAAQLLITAGQNIDRIASEAAFARLCGVAPIPASSGKTTRMRLHSGGDRQANRAIYLIAVGRLRSDPRSIAYRERLKAQGLDTNDIIRCLKRYAARELWNALKADLTTP